MVRTRRAAAAFGFVLLPIVAFACSFGGGPTADPGHKAMRAFLTMTGNVPRRV